MRFSTVIHSRGSPETLRDPRGFAVKFYTNEGNYDIVGNNFPVFFIRDGMKFPDMVHSLKPNPVNNQQEWWRIWDFFSNVPESMHMFTHLLDGTSDVTEVRDHSDDDLTRSAGVPFQISAFLPLTDTWMEQVCTRTSG